MESTYIKTFFKHIVTAHLFSKTSGFFAFKKTDYLAESTPEIQNLWIKGTTKSAQRLPIHDILCPVSNDTPPTLFQDQQKKRFNSIETFESLFRIVLSQDALHKTAEECYDKIQVRHIYDDFYSKAETLLENMLKHDYDYYAYFPQFFHHMQHLYTMMQDSKKHPSIAHAKSSYTVYLDALKTITVELETFISEDQFDQEMLQKVISLFGTLINLGSMMSPVTVSINFLEYCHIQVERQSHAKKTSEFQTYCSERSQEILESFTRFSSKELLNDVDFSTPISLFKKTVKTKSYTPTLLDPIQIESNYLATSKQSQLFDHLTWLLMRSRNENHYICQLIYDRCMEKLPWESCLEPLLQQLQQSFSTLQNLVYQSTLPPIQFTDEEARSFQTLSARCELYIHHLFHICLKQFPLHHDYVEYSLKVILLKPHLDPLLQTYFLKTLALLLKPKAFSFCLQCCLRDISNTDLRYFRSVIGLLFSDNFHYDKPIDSVHLSKEEPSPDGVWYNSSNFLWHYSTYSHDVFLNLNVETWLLLLQNVSSHELSTSPLLHALLDHYENNHVQHIVTSWIKTLLRYTTHQSSSDIEQNSALEILTLLLADHSIHEPLLFPYQDAVKTYQQSINDITSNILDHASQSLSSSKEWTSIWVRTLSQTLDQLCFDKPALLMEHILDDAVINRILAVFKEGIFHKNTATNQLFYSLSFLSNFHTELEGRIERALHHLYSDKSDLETLLSFLDTRQRIGSQIEKRFAKQQHDYFCPPSSIVMKAKPQRFHYHIDTYFFTVLNQKYDGGVSVVDDQELFQYFDYITFGYPEHVVKIIKSLFEYIKEENYSKIEHHCHALTEQMKQYQGLLTPTAYRHIHMLIWLSSLLVPNPKTWDLPLSCFSEELLFSIPQKSSHQTLCRFLCESAMERVTKAQARVLRVSNMKHDDCLFRKLQGIFGHDVYTLVSDFSAHILTLFDEFQANSPVKKHFIQSIKHGHCCLKKEELPLLKEKEHQVLIDHAEMLDGLLASFNSKKAWTTTRAKAMVTFLNKHPHFGHTCKKTHSELELRLYFWIPTILKKGAPSAKIKSTISGIVPSKFNTEFINQGCIALKRSSAAVKVARIFFLSLSPEQKCRHLILFGDMKEQLFSLMLNHYYEIQHDQTLPSMHTHIEEMLALMCNPDSKFAGRTGDGLLSLLYQQLNQSQTTIDTALDDIETLFQMLHNKAMVHDDGATELDLLVGLFKAHWPELNAFSDTPLSQKWDIPSCFDKTLFLTEQWYALYQSEKPSAFKQRFESIYHASIQCTMTIVIQHIRRSSYSEIEYKRLFSFLTYFLPDLIDHQRLGLECWSRPVLEHMVSAYVSEFRSEKRFVIFQLIELSGCWNTFSKIDQRRFIQFLFPAILAYSDFPDLVPNSSLQEQLILDVVQVNPLLAYSLAAYRSDKTTLHLSAQSEQDTLLREWTTLSTPVSNLQFPTGHQSFEEPLAFFTNCLRGLIHQRECQSFSSQIRELFIDHKGLIHRVLPGLMTHYHFAFKSLLLKSDRELLHQFISYCVTHSHHITEDVFPFIKEIWSWVDKHELNHSFTTVITKQKTNPDNLCLPCLDLYVESHSDYLHNCTPKRLIEYLTMIMSRKEFHKLTYLNNDRFKQITDYLERFKELQHPELTPSLLKSQTPSPVVTSFEAIPTLEEPQHDRCPYPLKLDSFYDAYRGLHGYLRGLYPSTPSANRIGSLILDQFLHDNTGVTALQLLKIVSQHIPTSKQYAEVSCNNDIIWQYVDQLCSHYKHPHNKVLILLMRRHLSIHTIHDLLELESSDALLEQVQQIGAVHDMSLMLEKSKISSRSILELGFMLPHSEATTQIIASLWKHCVSETIKQGVVSSDIIELSSHLQTEQSIEWIPSQLMQLPLKEELLSSSSFLNQPNLPHWAAYSWMYHTISTTETFSAEQVQTLLYSPYFKPFLKAIASHKQFESLNQDLKQSSHRFHRAMTTLMMTVITERIGSLADFDYSIPWVGLWVKQALSALSDQQQQTYMSIFMMDSFGPLLEYQLDQLVKETMVDGIHVLLSTLSLFPWFKENSAWLSNYVMTLTTVTPQEIDPHGDGHAEVLLKDCVSEGLLDGHYKLTHNSTSFEYYGMQKSKPHFSTPQDFSRFQHHIWQLFQTKQNQLHQVLTIINKELPDILTVEPEDSIVVDATQPNIHKSLSFGQKLFHFSQQSKGGQYLIEKVFSLLNQSEKSRSQLYKLVSGMSSEQFLDIIYSDHLSLPFRVSIIQLIFSKRTQKTETLLQLLLQKTFEKPVTGQSIEKALISLIAGWKAHLPRLAYVEKALKRQFGLSIPQLSSLYTRFDHQLQTIEDQPDATTALQLVEFAKENLNRHYSLFEIITIFLIHPRLIHLLPEFTKKLTQTFWNPTQPHSDEKTRRYIEAFKIGAQYGTVTEDHIRTLPRAQKTLTFLMKHSMMDDHYRLTKPSFTAVNESINDMELYQSTLSETDPEFSLCETQPEKVKPQATNLLNHVLNLYKTHTEYRQLHMSQLFFTLKFLPLSSEDKSNFLDIFKKLGTFLVHVQEVKLKHALSPEFTKVLGFAFPHYLSHPHGLDVWIKNLPLPITKKDLLGCNFTEEETDHICRGLDNRVFSITNFETFNSTDFFLKTQRVKTALKKILLKKSRFVHRIISVHLMMHSVFHDTEIRFKGALTATDEKLVQAYLSYPSVTVEHNSLWRQLMGAHQGPHKELVLQLLSEEAEVLDDVDQAVEELFIGFKSKKRKTVDDLKALLKHAHSNVGK